MLRERFELTDRVAIVSGGGRGIGRAVALALAEAGASVVCAARTVSELDQVVEQAQAREGRALAVRCDVNATEQIDEVVARAYEAFGGIDILVNVAGGTLPSPVLQTSQQVLEDAFHFNVGTAFHFCRQVVPPMLERDGGAIVNISSALSHMVEKGFVAYGTAKAALNHMTRLLAYELAPRVRVNALAVGAVRTDALAPFLAGDLERKMVERTPMGRLGTPEDVALAVLYLASPAASWVTGTVLEIDGGTVASNWPLELPALEPTTR
jgi:7-alpha-hydroxysteroid dehydrogenase